MYQQVLNTCLSFPRSNRISVPANCKNPGNLLKASYATDSERFLRRHYSTLTSPSSHQLPYYNTQSQKAIAIGLHSAFNSYICINHICTYM
jgi:hypothetical protein